jgi:hypothetical protein
MNIIEEAKRLLHSEDHRGLHPELHGFLRGVAEQKPACNATAQKIAERVPLPETYRHVTVYFGGEQKEVQVFRKDQLRAYGLAVAAEALRGAEAVARLPAHRERLSEIEDAVASGRMNAHQCFTQMRQLYTTPPAGSVEVTEERVERLAQHMLRTAYPDAPKGELDASFRGAYKEAWIGKARAALTAALNPEK